LTPLQRQDFTRFFAAVRPVVEKQVPGLGSLLPGKSQSLPEALRGFEEAGKFAPPGMRLFFRGCCRAYLGLEARNAGDWKAAAPLTDAAAKDLEQALPEPAVFDLSRLCRPLIVVYKTSLGAIGNQEQLRLEARQHLRNALGGGPVSPAFAKELRSLAEKAGDDILAKDIERFLNGDHVPGWELKK
jgi:hypothetical protein